MTPNSTSRRRWPWAVALLVPLGALGFTAWYIWLRQPAVKSDPVAATQANLRGIGHMERFEYPAAVTDFEEVVRLDPDWLPGQINLGIALLNAASENQEKRQEILKRASDIFRKVLEHDPDNLHAHYCLGLICLDQGRLGEAAPQFETVTRLDPTDAYAWLRRAQSHPEKDDAPETKEFYHKALELNPYLNAARHALAHHRFEYDEKKSKELLDQFQLLKDAHWETDFGLVYTEQGRYADVIGRVPERKPPSFGPLPLFERDESFRVTLAEGTRWAKADDLGDGILGDLRRAVRERFGGTIVRLDYNGDGRPDLLLLGAVVRGGAVADVLLRNDGGGRFTDVTAETGLDQVPASFGCSVADFDNDGRPDLLFTGPAGIRLFRNVDGKRFEDKTAAAGFDKVTGICLGSGWIDLDQDGDLDLLVAQYAATPEAALARLKGKENGGELLVFLNIGKAPPQPANGPPLGLTCRFRPATGPEALRVKGPVVAFAAADLDADRDVDLLVLADGQTPIPILNDRLLRFHRDQVELAGAHDWNGALVFDANHDEQSDLLLLPVGKKPLLLLSQRDTPATGLTDRFTNGATDSPPLRQAQAVDLDLDGWTDIVGISQDRQPVLLHNDGAGRLVHRHDALCPV